MFLIKPFFTTFFIWCICFCSEAGNLRKIQKALEAKKFDKAEKRILKSLAKDSVNPGAKFYLSVLLTEEEYAVYNVDSSWFWINNALTDLQQTNKKIEKELRKVQLDERDFLSQKARVAQLAFEQAVSQMSVAAFNWYMDHYEETEHFKDAVSIRDSLAFDLALNTNTWESYRAYFQSYPNSSYVSEARKRYQKLIFKDYTKDDKLPSYVKFLEEHPDTPFRRLAEEIIFTRSIRDHTWESYFSFLEKYPQTHLRKRIADMLYYKSKAQQYRNLELVFNTHTNPDSLRTIYELEKRILFPVFEGGVYGFMSLRNEMILKPQYQHISSRLLCGNIDLEWLQLDQKAINRNGEIVLDHLKDFEELGKEVVLVRDQRGRLYHKSGFRISDVQVVHAKVLTDGLIAFRAEYDWGLMTINGYQVIPPQYRSISLKGNFVILEQEDGFKVAGLDQLYVGSETDYLDLSFDDYEVIGDTLFQGFQGDRECLLDKHMNFLIAPDVHSIYVTRHNWYVRDATGYQIYEKKDTKLMNQKFDHLEANDGWITLKQQDGWLLISKAGVRPPVLNDLDSVKLISSYSALIQRGDSLQVMFQSGKRESLKSNEMIQVLTSQNAHYLLLSSSTRQRLYGGSGDLLFSSKYDELALLGDSLFRFKQSGKFGVVDKNGKVLVPAKYDLADEHEGLVFLLKGNSIGCYDMKRSLLISPDYEARIFPFGKGHYKIQQKGKVGLIDTLSQLTVPANYDELMPWNDSTLWARQNDQWKLITFDHSTVLDGIRSLNSWFEDEGEFFSTILTETGLGLLSNKQGEILPAEYNDILNIGSDDFPVFFAEQHLKAASFYVVTYVDRFGINIRSQAFRPEEYEKIYCDL